MPAPPPGPLALDIAERAPAEGWTPWRESIGPSQRRRASGPLDRLYSGQVAERLARGGDDQVSVRLGADDARAFRDALDSARAEGAQWLFHPACRLLAGSRPVNGQALAQLLLWTFAQKGSQPDAVLALERPVRFWTPAGPLELASGEHQAGDYIALFADPAPTSIPPVDLCWDVLGPDAADIADMPAGWRSPPIEELDPEALAQTIDDLHAYCSIMSLVCERFADMAAWLGAMVRLCLPIRRLADGKFKSASRPDIPGAVFFDMQADRHQVLEALIHECAHLYLFLEEVGGPLVDPTHAGTYASALRPEPRPLRGILLAYHALAHMAAMYQDLQSILASAAIAQDAMTIRGKLQDSRATLHLARAALTDRGLDLLARTDRVCDYAC